MKGREALQKIRSIRIPKQGFPVESTVSQELLDSIESKASIKKKIALMERHKHDEPYIDPDFMFRIPNNPYE